MTVHQASHSVICHCILFRLPLPIINQPKELVAWEYARLFVAPYIRMNRTYTRPEVNAENVGGGI